MNAETPISRTVTIHEAKTHLSRLIARVEAGEEIVIARGKNEVAKIVPLNPPPSKRRVAGRFSSSPGAKGILDHGFWDPLSADEMGLLEDVDPDA